ncbi:MAG: AMP-binding protein, partial [bacterium]|nr:AMP-binding protein [bacterium]
LKQSGAAGEEKGPGFVVEHVDVFEETGYDFDVVLEPGVALEVIINFNPRVFAQSFIESISACFLHLMKQVAADTQCTPERLELVNAEAKSRLLQQVTGEEKPYAPDTVAAVFQRQAERTPDAVALTGPGVVSLTYGELNRCAQRVAFRLKAKGAGPGSLIALLTGRSQEM